MSIYIKNEVYELRQGTMQEELETLEDNSIDSIVTDPPYELNFMSKSWDNTGVAFQKETWEKCLRVLKPGGYLLAFGGSRTYHRIACAIEDAGFEIRDTIMWIYGSGFPKSMNIGKAVEGKLTIGSANTKDFKKLNGSKVQSGNWGMSKMAKDFGHRPENYDEDGHMRLDKVDYQTEEGERWDGYGTALKPAFEPIIVARKPFNGSLVDNVLTYGVGGINIDECRIGTDTIKGGTTPDFRDVGRKSKEAVGVDKLSFGQVENAERIPLDDHVGRFPANVILTYDDTDFDEVCGGFPDTKSTQGVGVQRKERSSDTVVSNTNSGLQNKEYDPDRVEGFNDSGSASRYFYCAKASKKDRDEGLDCFGEEKVNDGRDTPIDNAFQRGETLRKNIHPTVKPTDLMQYLVRLVTPKGGTVLDPFMGSGSTGKACMIENTERNANYKFIGVEMTEEYLPICHGRIQFGLDYVPEVVVDNSTVEITPKEPEDNQLTFSLFL